MKRLIRAELVRNIRGYLDLAKIDWNTITYDDAVELFNQDDTTFYSVPQNLIDYDFAKLAVKKNGYRISHVPKDLIDYDLARLAFDKYPMTIEYIPENLIDIDMARTAARYLDSLLQYVPMNLINSDSELKQIYNSYKKWSSDTETDEKNRQSKKFKPSKDRVYNILYKECEDWSDYHDNEPGTAEYDEMIKYMTKQVKAVIEHEGKTVADIDELDVEFGQGDGVAIFFKDGTEVYKDEFNDIWDEIS